LKFNLKFFFKVKKKRRATKVGFAREEDLDIDDGSNEVEAESAVVAESNSNRQESKEFQVESIEQSSSQNEHNNNHNDDGTNSNTANSANEINPVRLDLTSFESSFNSSEAASLDLDSNKLPRYLLS
jgi:hypothetical protein